MKSFPAQLIVSVSIDPNERDRLFDQPLQNYLGTENAGEIVLVKPNLRNDENGRFSWGFTMDFSLLNQEKAIKCIRLALQHIPATAVEFEFYDDLIGSWVKVEI